MGLIKSLQEVVINNQKEAKEAISGVYKPAGSVLFTNLPSLTEERVGNVYDIKDDFTTTSDFVEGNGKSYSAGTNVLIFKDENGNLKYDCLAGVVVPPSLTVDDEMSDTSENPVQNKVIKGALGDITELIPSDASTSNKLVTAFKLDEKTLPYVVYPGETITISGHDNKTGNELLRELLEYMITNNITPHVGDCLEFYIGNSLICGCPITYVSTSGSITISGNSYTIGNESSSPSDTLPIVLMYVTATSNVAPTDNAFTRRLFEFYNDNGSDTFSISDESYGTYPFSSDWSLKYHLKSV